MDPVIFAAADVTVPTGIPTGVPGAEAGAAVAKILAADSVYGPLLILAGFAIIGLSPYIRSLHAARGVEAKDAEKTIRELQEKRIEELRSLTRAQADAEAILSKFTETVGGLSRTFDALASSLRESGAKHDATASMVEKTLGRIEEDIGELSKKIDRPLVQTKQGLTRNPGALS